MNWITRGIIVSIFMLAIVAYLYPPTLHYLGILEIAPFLITLSIIILLVIFLNRTSEHESVEVIKLQQ